MSKFIKTQLELAKAKMTKTEEVTFAERKESIDAGLKMSQDRQNHDLQGEIYKLQDTVTKFELESKELSKAEVLNFTDIAESRKRLKVAQANLELYKSLQTEFFADEA